MGDGGKEELYYCSVSMNEKFGKSFSEESKHAELFRELGMRYVCGWDFRVHLEV